MASSYPILLLVIFLSVGYSSSEDEDYFTSLLGLQRLARKEQDIISAILSYRRLLLERLSLLEGYLEDYNSTFDSLRTLSKFPRLERTVKKFKDRSYVPLLLEDETEDLDELAEYVSSSPILAFKLIRRVAKDWGQIVNSLSTEIEEGIVAFADEIGTKVQLPSRPDVQGALDGLLRVQSVFGISTRDGKLWDSSSSRVWDVGELSSPFDHYLLGRRALRNNHFYSTSVEWLKLAYDTLSRNSEESSSSGLSLSQVTTALHDAIEIHNERRLDHSMRQTLEEYEYTKHLFFPKALSHNLTQLNCPDKKDGFDYLVDVDMGSAWSNAWNYMALCSGHDLTTPEDRQHLHCYYKRDTPFTLLNPVPVEVHSVNPRILQFYNVLSPTLIAHIKKRGEAGLRRAKVVGSGVPGKKDMPSDVRTSSTMWLHEGEGPVLRKIPQVIQTLTGLDSFTPFSAEDLQLSVYGPIGGHYKEHYDSLFEGQDISPQERLRGDRIATVMFYLSDVPMGGATAFPRLGIAIRPAKGSAVFWYNLKTNGERDPLSLHGGCPVGLGTKWVANKWIRSTQQMLHRPCSLSQES